MLVAKEDDSDEDSASHYFVGAVEAHLGDDEGDDDECVYSPNAYSVLISTTTTATNPETGGIWAEAVYMLVLVVIALLSTSPPYQARSA